MTTIPEPKTKPSNRWTRLGPKFPVFDKTDYAAKYHKTVLTAFYESGRVWVEDRHAMEDLYSKGYFGKGTLSRGAPTYEKTGEVYTSSTYEFKDVEDLRPFPPPKDLEELNQEEISEDQEAFEVEISDDEKQWFQETNEDQTEWSEDHGRPEKTLSAADEEELDAQHTANASKSGGVDTPMDESYESDLEKKESAKSFVQAAKLTSLEHSNDQNLIDTEMNDDEASDFETDNLNVELMETLELMLEEAFFLKYCFGCLEVKDRTTSKFLNCEDLWKLFSSLDDRFSRRYVAYHYYRSKGWVVRSGLIFGGDFALYKDGPPHYHSTFVVLVKDAEEPGLTWIQMSALVRVTEKMSKNVIICEIVRKDSSGYEFGHLDECQVRELMIKRWVPSK